MSYLLYVCHSAFISTSEPEYLTSAIRSFSRQAFLVILSKARMRASFECSSNCTAFVVSMSKLNLFD